MESHAVSKVERDIQGIRSEMRFLIGPHVFRTYLCSLVFGKSRDRNIYHYHLFLRNDPPKVVNQEKPRDMVYN
eukprot:scaffold1849_cov115-Cylindrotheca_fusiformis.AAC.1